MRLTRRSFIQASAATGGALLAGCAAGKPATNAMGKTTAKSKGEEAGKWIANTCQGCTTWCPIEIFVQNGRAVKVRGNQLSKANGGYVCPRGHLILQQIYDPDRIKTPMKRTNPKKGRDIDPKFVPISWDEAMDTVADKIIELRKNNESHKFLLMRGRYSDQNGILYGNIPKMIGSPNNISHSSICAEVEKMGAYYTEGYFGYRDYDLDNMKYLIVWACDPISSNRQVPNAIRKIHKILENGTVAAIDPRMSNTAAKAHEWMPITPATDGAVAIAMAHHILVNGLWSKEFCGDFKDGRNRFVKGQTVSEGDFNEKNTNGLVKWWNIALKDADPAWAAKEAGVDKAQIERIATGFAKAAPNCGVWYGPNMQPRGTYAVMAMHALNGLVGATDSVGGVVTGMGAPSSGYPKIDAHQDEQAKKGSKKTKIDQRGYLNMPALKEGKSGGGVVANNVANAILANDPYDIKVAIGYFNNFNFSSTEGQRWDEAMAKVPFFAHIVPMFSEMTYFADIVLPSTLHHSEQWSSVRSKANLYGHVSIQQPVINRMFDVQAPETEIVWMLADKLAAKGFPNIMNWLKDFKDPETGKAPTNAEEFGLYAVKIRTHKAWDPAQNKDYKGDRPSGWKEFVEKGIVNSSKYEFGKKWKDGFSKTATKKFEFYSETLKKALEGHADKHSTTVDNVLTITNYEARGELAFVPHYETPKRHGSRSAYPFDLIDMKSRHNREGRSANTTWSYTFKSCDPGDVNEQDVIQINPADARRLGINEGDMVKVTSVLSSLTVKARLWEGVRPGCVAKCYGQGHHAMGRVAAKDFARAVPRGANFNMIMPDDYDRLSGSTARNGGFTGVRIEKA